MRALEVLQLKKTTRSIGGLVKPYRRSFLRAKLNNPRTTNFGVRVGFYATLIYIKGDILGPTLVQKGHMLIPTRV